MSEIDRRTFLAGSAALPFLYGLGEAQDAGAVDAALAQAKEKARWAVLLVAPDDASERFGFGQRLWALTAFEEDAEAHELFCQAVFVVAPQAAAAARSPGLRKDATRVLFSPEGQVLAADAAPPAFSSGAAFAESFRPFVHGARGERLEAAARAVERSLAPELREAAEKLGSNAFDERLAGRTTLLPRMDGLAVYVGWLAGAGGGSELRRRQARLLLSSYYASLPEKAPGARVPFGCSGPHSFDPCRSCGLGRIPERSRMYLRILTGNPAEDNPRRDDE